MMRKSMSRFLYAVVICVTALGLAASPAFSTSIIRMFDVVDASISDAPLSAASRSNVQYTSTGFTLNFGPGLVGNPAAQSAFTQAAARWSALLRDPVTVVLDVNYQSLAPGILGQASTTMLYGGFNTVRNLVSNNAGETNDAREAALLPNLPTASQFSAYLPAGFSMNGYGWLTQANYLALGGTRLANTDGSISLSSNYSWDFDPSDGIAPGYFDFQGVTMHEIGHALGSSSEVDYVDIILCSGLTANDVWPRPLDFFRFDTGDLSDPSFDFTTTPRDLAPGGSHSFYHGDGSVLLSTGMFDGDGYQASHWKDNLEIGLMDPTAAPGELLSVTSTDLVAFDLIGWNVVPEPATLLLFGTGLLGLAFRRRKRG